MLRLTPYIRALCHNVFYLSRGLPCQFLLPREYSTVLYLHVVLLLTMTGITGLPLEYQNHSISNRKWRKNWGRTKSPATQSWYGKAELFMFLLTYILGLERWLRVDKKTDCSSGGAGFDSQHPHDSAQLSVPPGYLILTKHRHSIRQNICTYIRKNNLKVIPRVVYNQVCPLVPEIVTGDKSISEKVCHQKRNHTSHASHSYLEKQRLCVLTNVT